jgi:hypothetical protein
MSILLNFFIRRRDTHGISVFRFPIHAVIGKTGANVLGAE